MLLNLEIPKEFEAHFNDDRFEDSLMRAGHYRRLAGKYDIEVVDMLIEALKKALIVDEVTIAPNGKHRAEEGENE